MAHEPRRHNVLGWSVSSAMLVAIVIIALLIIF